jgi:hypothetical protein
MTGAGRLRLARVLLPNSLKKILQVQPGSGLRLAG